MRGRGKGDDRSLSDDERRIESIITSTHLPITVNAFLYSTRTVRIGNNSIGEIHVSNSENFVIKHEIHIYVLMLFIGSPLKNEFKMDSNQSTLLNWSHSFR